MFDSFKRKRRIGIIVGTIYPQIHSCQQEDGTFDRRLETDEYVLAYIFGVIIFMIDALGVASTLEKGIIYQTVFANFFSERCKEITDLCNSRVKAREPEFRHVIKTAYIEINEAFESLNSTGEISKSLSLQKHVLEHYL